MVLKLSNIYKMPTENDPASRIEMFSQLEKSLHPRTNIMHRACNVVKVNHFFSHSYCNASACGHFFLLLLTLKKKKVNHWKNNNKCNNELFMI